MENYSALARTCPMVAVFGESLRVSDSALRGVELCAGDPLTREWIVIAIGGHTSSAILAREVETTFESDDKRMFDFAVTHDRSIISSAARLLMQRIG